MTNPVVMQMFEDQVDAPFWFKHDCVYRCRCLHCGEHYTGETGQYLVKRMYQHNYNYIRNTDDKSALAEHCMQAHPGLPIKLEMVKVIDTNGYVDRKITESVLTQLTSNSLNRRIEGAGAIGNLYW